jgi:Tol biopolymer transport system component
MNRGTFVCDRSGTVLARIGLRDAPVWTRDGKWIIYMNDRDDGERMLSSDIYCVTPDGTRTIRLTATPDVMEMNPQCSPTEDRIVCDSPDGDIYMITYAEQGK